MKTEYDLTITKLNDTYLRIDCKEPHMEIELSDRFKFKNKGVEFDVRVKRGVWDGYIRLYNRTHKRIYTGLLMEVLKFAKGFDYSVKVDPALFPTSKIELSDIEDVVNDFIRPHDKGQPLIPYDYQFDSIHYALNMNRSISLAATSSGKSLIIYILTRMYQMMDEFDGKTIFIVVPSIMLVDQLYADFDNYSNYEGSKWRPASFVQKVNGKHSKFIDKQIVITTWQSLAKIPAGHIIDAGAILVDEVQSVAGPVLCKLLEAAVNCPIRHGFTGTLPDEESSILSAEGLVGPSKVIVTAQENIEAGRATRLAINVVVIDYDKETKLAYHQDQKEHAGEMATMRYNAEVDFINQLQCRRDFIIDLVRKSKGNTIVLFNRVDSYGVHLYEACKAVHENTFLIVGDVEGDEREVIKNMLEGISDGILFATDKLMSTGVSIKNLHNGVLASSSKAKIKLIQTLGRFMRLHESKKIANVYDLVDKLDYNGRSNFVLTHVEERLKRYMQEGHKVKFVAIKLKEVKAQ